ncbi:MAG: hypothetical protein QW228_08650 [Candidatus Aenigmatarchaeota archaeon]
MMFGLKILRKREYEELIEVVEKLEAAWEDFAKTRLEELEACRDVNRHILFGNLGCPTEVLCKGCWKKDTCRFGSTVQDVVGENEREWHIELKLSYFAIQDLLKVKRLLLNL